MKTHSTQENIGVLVIFYGRQCNAVLKCALKAQFVTFKG